ncbi:protein TBATA isoform X4 [Alexandromys fortis]|uniref:protein TBATA isoform X4 n=1 Tax=Alexandromys fortis TaxID=100897 RepID=UPI002152BB8C|nr:protein TBATA isoform X4 [Microtus fortis]
MIRGVSTGTQPTLAKMQEIAMRGWSSLKRKKPGSSLRWCPVQSPSQRSLIAHSSLCTHHQSTRAAPSIENTGIRILVFTSLVANPVMTTEVKTQVAEQPLVSPKAEPEPEKKPEHFPKSHGDVGFQKEPVVPGIVDFELIQEELKTSSKPQTPSAYRFGRLSHHSFFSRHHPQPQHVTHIQDLTGKPVCVVRDEFSLAPVTQSALLSSSLMGMPTISVPIGDPQSNRNPQLPPDLWKKNLKDLASQVAVFTKENESRTNEAGAEPKSEPGKKALPKEEPPVREQGAKYSAETGRLIPASSQALSRRNRQGQRGHPSARDGGAQASLLEDQELLGSHIAPGVRFSGPMGRGPRADLGASLSDSTDGFFKCHPILAALCTTKGKRLGAGTSADGGGSAHPPAPPNPPRGEALEPTPRASRTSSRDTTGNLQSIPEEDEDATSIQDGETRVDGQSPSPPRASQRGLRGENDQVKGRELRNTAQSPETSV